MDERVGKQAVVEDGPEAAPDEDFEGMDGDDGEKGIEEKDSTRTALKRRKQGFRILLMDNNIPLCHELRAGDKRSERAIKRMRAAECASN